MADAIINPNLFSQEEDLLYDTGSERAFLAMLVKKPDLIVEAERLIPPEFLHRRANAYTYQCMLYIYSQATGNGWAVAFDDVSMLRVAEYLGRQDRFLEETRNLQHIREIMAMSRGMDDSQWPAIVSAIQEAHHRVKVYRAGRIAQQKALDKTGNPSIYDVAGSMEIEFNGISIYDGPQNNESRITKLSDEGPAFLAKCYLAANNADKSLFNVGCDLFPFLMDLMNGGWRRGGLYITAARPKVGKSTWLQEIARYASIYMGIPVLYIDTEMNREQIYSRTLSSQSDTPEFDILKGRFEGVEQSRVRVDEAVSKLSDAPLYYVNVKGRPVQYAVSVMRQFRRQIVGNRTIKDKSGNEFSATGVGIIIYDWIQLPDAGALKNAAEFQLLGFVASTLKAAAKEVDLPVLAGAQNNRGAIGMTHKDFVLQGEAFVASSDRLAQYCDMLAILRNVDFEEEEKIANQFPLRQIGKYEDARNRLLFNQVLHVMIQRGGPDCRDGIPLYIDRGRQRYEETVWRWSENAGDGKPGYVDAGTRDFLHEGRARKKLLRRETSSGKPIGQVPILTANPGA